MTKNNFGNLLKSLRIKKELSLRDVCKLTEYDPSNWSKIERGKMFPPSSIGILNKWAKVLGLKGKDIQDFTDQAIVAQGMIPREVLSEKDLVEHLPAFFRTLRNKKPNKEEIERMIELIKNS
jgi:transcriptional regulator with XRE-family HTH domain